MQEKFVGLELRNLSILLKRKIQKFEFGEVLVSGMHGWVIAYIWEASKKGDVFQKDIEKTFSMRRSTATEILKAMEKNELIERIPYKKDGRLKQIILSEKAKEHEKKLKKIMLETENLMINGIDARNLDIFFNVLKQMQFNLEGENV